MAPATRPVVMFHTNDQGQAAGGYDVVAYFSGTAKKGDDSHRAEYGGATFLFTSTEHCEQFISEPSKYAPQYGGWCAMGMAGGYKAPTDPLAFTVVDGKLYLNYNAKVTEMWKKDMAGHIAKADKNWVEVAKK
jgi:YHS domain-containing protein